ncbi:hypothetical protein HPB49_013453 [Dermacentor silvarum]|uniref:Uncharacterized protein n=1 Tax=Dermacentor silvarum TaxID=543639 RepID=A0ACB8D5V1_DERSI|nr:hypothetical protein HPB49_013453 [Dermacentor silvarum]
MHWKHTDMVQRVSSCPTTVDANWTEHRQQCIDVLAEIVAAVGDKLEVYLDSGVRTGADVVKALALGARAVFVGRPVLWGLAYNVRMS